MLLHYLMTMYDEQNPCLKDMNGVNHSAPHKRKNCAIPNVLDSSIIIYEIFILMVGFDG